MGSAEELNHRSRADAGLNLQGVDFALDVNSGLEPESGDSLPASEYLLLALVPGG
ncbi:hypothetical protein PGT21_025042 [Puccinia graminis f. sp. tritici]|uniref:Uncharacterized protein n=1 Tax=Puccinia graminis f. sp. tritici TaxID=56615 RepID=A0A5B0QLD8_PUCGR|nr:hypothetical protein PGT21_025042 [Puccinia graminis f. sp. tritici]KAA1113785.1 hypothetical protein PGTUg99_020322 [Puccinia graminis f. sp. tritici]